MSIQMIGIDHGRAPIPVRECFAFTKKACGETYEKLKEQPQVAGCIILSTCNRTEVWFDSAEEAALPLKQWLCKQKNLSVDEYEKYLVVRQGAEAVEHLLHMTSGLRSLIVGEDQVLSQVRDAWSLAREWEATDKVLDVLFRMAVTGAKQVKTHMQISTANTSAIEYAIRYLKEQDYSFRGKTCMVIGNGEMGKRTALALLAEGADVTVTVRQYRSGVVEIPEGCKRINYGDRLSFLPQCDLVASATSSPNMTLKFEDVSPVHPSRTQVYLDLAVPRDIDPKLAELPGVRLYDIDQFPAEMGSEELAACLAVAEEILKKQLDEFFTWYECRDMVPRVKKLGEIASSDLYWRMGKTLKKLQLTPESSVQLEAAVRDASEKVIQKLLFSLRDEVGTDEFRHALGVMEGVYHE